MTTSRWIVPGAMLLGLTVCATNAYATKPFGAEIRLRADQAEAAKVRGLSINPMSNLRLDIDRSLRTPEVKAAMGTLVRYIRTKTARGYSKATAVLVDKDFVVAHNGKIYSYGRGSAYPGGVSGYWASPVTAESGVSAARVAAKIERLASKVERGGEVTTQTVIGSYP